LAKIFPTDWKTQVKIFEKFGCVFVRQKGDHLIYNCPDARRPVVIPKYSEVTVTIIRTNMRTVGMSRKEYFNILESI
jgi:predicted RNA binding protein YcfA (HicA-like mRNA interferase family)